MSLLTPRFRKAIENLPASPVLVLARLRDEVGMWQREPQAPDDGEKLRQLLAFIRKYVAKNDLDIHFPPNDDGDVLEVIIGSIDEFVRHYEYEIIDKEIEELVDSANSITDDNSFGFAHLNQSEKERVHGNIGRIRKLIEESGLTTRKKNALYDRLNQLAGEVDRDGTKTDRFFAFMGDTAFVLGDMANKAKPFTDEVKDMIKTIGKARSRKEGTALPPGEEVLKLPAPDGAETDDAH